MTRKKKKKSANKYFHRMIKLGIQTQTAQNKYFIFFLERAKFNVRLYILQIKN